MSEIAGTTRDAVDTEIIWNKKPYVFIDTAGLRRKSKVKEELERYSIIRTVTAVERADVVVVVIDAQEGITEQDAKIAGIAHERGQRHYYRREQVGCCGEERQDRLPLHGRYPENPVLYALRGG